MGEMPHVSRPLVAVLLATVVFFAVWVVALKPKSDSGSSGGSAPLQSAVDKAHAAVTQSNKASVAHGGTIATTPTSSTPQTSTLAAHGPNTPASAAATKPATTTPSTNPTATTHTTATTHATVTTHKTVTRPRAASAVHGAAQRQAVVVRALRERKVIALLFYNHLAADDRAVKRELAVVPTHGGKVVKLAVPLNELARYGIVTRQVPVTQSPTLIIIDRSHKAWTVVGYATEFEISQRVTDALAVKPKSKAKA
jgi:hypothetical protein